MLGLDSFLWRGIEMESTSSKHNFLVTSTRVIVNTAMVVISTRVQPLFLAPKKYALTTLCKILIGILRGALCLLNWHHVPAAAASG